MKKLRHKFILYLLFIFFFKALPSVSAQTIYIDAAIGDNSNPGTSPTAPLKSPRSDRAEGNDQLIFLRTMTIQKQRMASDAASRKARIDAGPQLERIILGPKILAGWDSFSDTIWYAPLDLQTNWQVIDITVNGTSISEGCARDFLNSGQYYLQANTLYINDNTGNPDSVGNPVKLSVYDNQTGEYNNFNVSGWAPSPPSVWQISFPSEPIHVFVDEALFDQYWWYGKQYCDAEAGQDNFLYLRDSAGNPEAEGKATTAIVETGGWATSSGDFNGDGIQDVVHSNGGQKSEVAARIYVNYGASEFSPSPEQILANPNGEPGFGYYVASAGDVNNDGFDDLLVAMDWGVGKVYLYKGSQSGLDNTPSQVLTPPAQYPTYGFGHGIAGNGDINGDEYSDILIMGGNASSAYLCVYLGSNDSINSVTMKETIEFNNKEYNGSVCIVGDMNNDGYDEVALSMPAIVSDQTPADNVEIMIYQGSQDGRLKRSGTLNFEIPKQKAIAFGAVAPAGDINNDGLADLIIGNQWAEGAGGFQEGAAYLVLGSKDGPSAMPDISISNPEPEADANFGRVVAGLGNFDRKGNDDIAIGCPYGRGGDGFVIIYSGSDKGISEQPAQIISGYDNFGWSISAAGKIKNNGQPYLIAAELETGAGGAKPGAAYLYALPCDTHYYEDADGDHYGNRDHTLSACEPPSGYVIDDTDCADTDEDIHPGAEEICNGVDDNCNDEVDEGCLPPAADAGADREMVEGGLVMLDGSASSPAEASRPITVYTWTQIDGPNVFMSGADTAGPSFMTPAVGPDGAVLVFQLTVQDTFGFSDTDQVAITIRDNGITGFPPDVLTFISATGQPVGIKVHGDASLLKIVPVDPVGLPETDNTPGAMTYGVFNFMLRVPNPGSKVDVTFYLPSPAETDQVWCRYNAADGWSNYSASTLAADRKSITIHLTDGAAGDDDQTANGIIDNVSGLGVIALEPSGNDTDSGDGGGGGGGGGCFISTMDGAAD